MVRILNISKFLFTIRICCICIYNLLGKEHAFDYTPFFHHPQLTFCTSLSYFSFRILISSSVYIRPLSAHNIIKNMQILNQYLHIFYAKIEITRLTTSEVIPIIVSITLHYFRVVFSSIPRNELTSQKPASFS